MKSSALRPQLFSINSQRSTVYGLQSAAAFTLIEVLVAMAVLSILILLAANIFQGSSSAFNIGSQKASMNIAARAALDFLARELESAVAGPVETSESGGAQYLTFQVEDRDDIRFLTLNNDPQAAGGERALRGVFFWHDNAEKIIKYHREVGTPSPLDCYDDATPDWANNPSSSRMLITNVCTLNFYVYANEADLLSGNDIDVFSTTLNELPFCVDIVLEMLSDDDMTKYLASGSEDFRERNAKFYTTRVYFPNRMGYQ